MATIKYNNATTDIWLLDWDFFYAYDGTFTETDNMDGTFTTVLEMTVADWAADDFAYDKIVVTVTYTEDDLHAFEEGDLAGEDEALLIGGTMDSITYHADDVLLATVTDLPEYATPYFSQLVQTDDVANFSATIITGNNTIVGTKADPYDEWGDIIVTGFGKDSVNAKAGDDLIYDVGGRDVYNGAAGDDLLSYAAVYWDPVFVISGITANLDTGQVVGFDGKTDKVKNIERVAGTFLDDTFIGDANDNVFYGLGGADDFDGGDGFDRLDYKDDDNQGGYDGIKVDTAAGTIRDGFGYTDTFTDIERISGTYTRDAFIDDDSSMYYDGRDGNDVFRIRGGDDTLRGRDGEDRFIFIGNNFGTNEIRDYEQGVDEIKINKLTDASQLSGTQVGNDAVVDITIGGNVSTIIFSDFQLADLSEADFGL